jgi:uncharacterized protein
MEIYTKFPCLLEEMSYIENWPEVLEEFLDCYLLVPVGFDERSLVVQELVDRQSQLKTGHLVNAIQLNVSEGCNLKCSYCFADRVDERSSVDNLAARNEQRFMTLEKAIESIDSVGNWIRQSGGRAMVVKFFGREPLLNWTTIQGVLERYYSTTEDFKYYFAITTNGTLFTAQIVSFFSRVGMLVVVSLDGLQEANLARLTHDGRESFSLVDRGLRLLQDQGVNCGVASVLSKFRGFRRGVFGLFSNKSGAPVGSEAGHAK